MFIHYYCCNIRNVRVNFFRWQFKEYFSLTEQIYNDFCLFCAKFVQSWWDDFDFIYKIYHRDRDREWCEDFFYVLRWWHHSHNQTVIFMQAVHIVSVFIFDMWKMQLKISKLPEEKRRRYNECYITYFDLNGSLLFWNP